MSGSFALERGLSVAFLGPEGSFSHMAATRHFGSSVTFSDIRSIDAVFEEVAKRHVNYGLVPYENSIGGGITDTLVAFQSNDVKIYSEAMIEISHCLLTNCEPDEIEKIYSKPQIFEQCHRWLADRYPQAQLIPTASSAAAVRQASQESRAAAIGSELAGEIYGVGRLYEKIQDHPNNITRFLVIGTESALPTGQDKTTLMFVTAHKPGALVDVLTVFRDRDINLSHIDKRPSGRENWEYTFFIDCEAHQDEASMRAAIEDAKSHCLSLKVLGSYPQATRVL
jgi:chorismate mutase/prephenate dehydratase